MRTHRHALAAALVGACALASGSAHAQEVESYDAHWDFENAPSSGWFFGGSAGYDVRQGFAHWGYDNVWVNAAQRGTWNAVNVIYNPGAVWADVTNCTITAWIQTSPTFTDGRLDVWDWKGSSLGSILSDNYVQASPQYAQQTFYVDVSASGPDAVLMDFGFWGQGTDQWMRVDDVHVQCWQYDVR